VELSAIAPAQPKARHAKHVDSADAHGRALQPSKSAGGSCAQPRPRRRANPWHTLIDRVLADWARTLRAAVLLTVLALLLLAVAHFISTGFALWLTGTSAGMHLMCRLRTRGRFVCEPTA
jgi:hypothetical protein